MHNGGRTVRPNNPFNPTPHRGEVRNSRLIAEKNDPRQESHPGESVLTPRRRGTYGIDAPYGPAFMAAIAALEFALAVSFGNVLNLLAGLFVLAILGLYLHGTLRGKFVIWAKL